ncbi:MAG TPA: hypothetical protein VHD32_04090 [Candidatus Didemnitutus sp.]|nr:hypothetical protein [Candidatus Didemnitutus sp.]
MDDSRRPDDFVLGRPQWWQWLTILSLDAPLVAVAWQRAVTAAAGARRDSAPWMILGASVWLAYTADRWIEGWRLEPSQVRTQRHRFYQRWRIPVAVVWCAVALLAIGLAFLSLSRVEIESGFLIFVPVIVYLLSHQLVHREKPWRAPKEICVALLFVGGVACFPLAARPEAIHALATPLFLFGLLCFADCALISNWEDEVDLSHGQTSLALQYPRGRIVIRYLPWVIAALAVAAMPYAATGRSLVGCAAGSGILLGILDVFHRRLGRQFSRAVVDIALMTPFLLVFAPPGPTP